MPLKNSKMQLVDLRISRDYGSTIDSKHHSIHGANKQMDG